MRLAESHPDEADRRTHEAAEVFVEFGGAAGDVERVDQREIAAGLRRHCGERRGIRRMRVDDTAHVGPLAMRWLGVTGSALLAIGLWGAVTGAAMEKGARHTAINIHLECCNHIQKTRTIQLKPCARTSSRRPANGFRPA